MAAFSAIATNAQNIADTLSMTNEEIKRSGNIVDDEVSKFLYDRAYASVKYEDFDAKDYQGEYRDKLE